MIFRIDPLEEFLGLYYVLCLAVDQGSGRTGWHQWAFHEGKQTLETTIKQLLTHIHNHLHIAFEQEAKGCHI